MMTPMLQQLAQLSFVVCTCNSFITISYAGGFVCCMHVYDKYICVISFVAIDKELSFSALNANGKREIVTRGDREKESEKIALQKCNSIWYGWHRLSIMHSTQQLC